MSPSMGGRLMRVFSRTFSGLAAMTSDVSKEPAWSPARNASPSFSAQRFFVMSVKQTLAPAFAASSTAFLTVSTCAGSRWMFTMATARKRRARATDTSRSRAVAVAAGRLIVPGKSAPNSATVKFTGGAISEVMPRCLSLAAARRDISTAMMLSAETGRWGPWASVAPTGTRARGRSFIACSTSVQVISDISTFSAMILEKDALSFAPFLHAALVGGVLGRFSDRAFYTRSRYSVPLPGSAGPLSPPGRPRPVEAHLSGEEDQAQGDPEGDGRLEHGQRHELALVPRCHPPRVECAPECQQGHPPKPHHG